MRRLLTAPWLPAAVFGVALLARIVTLLQAGEHPLDGYVGALIDSRYYERHALEVARGDFLHDTPFFLGPLYPYAMGLLYALFGPSLAAVRAGQAILGAASCVVLFWIGERVFDRRVALGAGLLLAVYPLHLYYTTLLLPTLLVTFLNLLLLWLLLRQVDAPSPSGAAGVGLVLGLAVLSKSNALLLLPLLLGVWLWLSRSRPQRLRLVWSGLFVLATLLTVAPATLHNAEVSGRFVLVTTSTGRNLWKGNGPPANGTHPLGDPNRYGTGMGPRLAGRADPVQVVEASGAYLRDTLAHVRENPGATAVLLGRKLLLFFHAVELGVRDQFYFARERIPVLRLPVGYAWVAPLGLAGAIAAWSLRGRALVLHAMLAAQVVSFVGVFVLARYRLVAVACLSVFAVALLVRWADAARERRFREVLPTALLALAAAVPVNWPLAEFPPDRGYALVYRKIGDRHREAGRHAQAAAAYTRALDEDWQGQPPAARRAETRLDIARELEATGDRAGAAEQLRILMREAPPDDARAARAAERAREQLLRLDAAGARKGDQGARAAVRGHRF